MLPLTLEDLLPLEEYAGRRREFFEAQCRYLDRYRRVRVGPRATLSFENRQTLWFRVQEELAPWQALRGEELALVLGPARCPDELVTCRPEDRCIGTAHWVRFAL